MLRTDQHGFTVLEALVTAFIVAVVTTFSIPSMMSALRAHSLAGATRVATNHVRVTRAMAVARHTRARLAVTNGSALATDIFDTSTNTWVRAGNGVALHGGVTVTQVTPTAGIIFEPEGTASSAGSVRLRNAPGDERLISVSILGAIEASS